MEKKNLKSLLQPKRNELSELQRLCKETQKQIDDAVEQGNDTLLTLQQEFEELANKKRELLRDIEKLEDRLERVRSKVSYTENTYGEYLKAIKEGKKNEPEV
jgi:predicted  nucleic acid-binding Zn-ribbon protein